MNDKQETVILLHGLARTRRSMAKLALSLEHAGYTVVNHCYPSTKYPIKTLAKNEIPKALKQCKSPSKIHFVTHSMGGILLRQYLAINAINNLGRVVMLGPPNQGSQVVDKLRNMPVYKLINGPSGMQLGTDKNSIPANLGSANFDLGIIAGTRSINLILSTMLPNPNDGKVSVENTKLNGMADHLTLPVTHSFMMNNKGVILQIINFLKHGTFNKRF